MRLFLITAYELTIEQTLTFLVHAETRNQAKGAVRRECKEHEWDISSYLSTHDLGEETPLIRIDHLLR